MKLFKVAVAALVMAMLAPMVMWAEPAQAQTLAQPDLVSDAPDGGVLQVIGADPANNNPGQFVLKFNGYVTNLGDGPLEVSGNPQISNPNDPLGMKQRSLIAGTDRTDPANWVDVGTPLVQFEVDDGHNHFHLMEIGRYSMWNVAQTAEVAPGLKVGFCLYDIDDLPGRHPNPGPQTYTGAVTSFCDQNDPTSTDLRMGTTEGWRDVYSTFLTFQWIDISNVSPGEYWLANEADPNNRIVEKDESNNQIAYAAQKSVVPGFVPKAIPVAGGALSANSGANTVNLQTTAYGGPGPREFEVVQAPANGTLSVSVGTPFTQSSITYTPTPGYTGPDNFLYIARDQNSAFPLNPQSAAVSINVGSSNAASVAISGAPQAMFTSTAVQLNASVNNCGSSAVNWKVNGIAGGNATVGTVDASGLYTAPNSPPAVNPVTVRATSQGCQGAFDEVSILIEEANTAPTINQIGTQSSPVGVSAATTMSASDPEGDVLTWSANGLPPGTGINTNTGRVSGTPTAGGSYTINVTVWDGEFYDTMSYVWNITWNDAAEVAGVLASGDFNGDGKDDVAVGVPGEDVGSTVDAGAVNVVMGSGAGLTTNNNKLLTQGLSGAGAVETGDAFGSAVAAGDFDGDGKDDLAVGVPLENIGSKVDAGAVNVFYGNSAGLGQGTTWSQNGPVVGVAEAGDNFGAAVASGDFNNDGFDDLAIGVPGEDIAGRANAGAVNILYGSANGLTTAGNASYSQSGAVDGALESGDLFGSSLAAGNIKGSGADDLVVGVPGEDAGSRSDSGSINVLYGSNNGITLAGNKAFSQAGAVAGTVEAGDFFGTAVAVGDVTGDGKADVIIGSPGENTNKADVGVVNLLKGSAAGLTTSGAMYTQARGSGSVEAGDQFGSSLAIGKVDGDGRADVIIGAPGENIGATADAGSIHVLFGTTSGLAGGGQSIFAGFNAPGLAEAGDAFGAAVASGDFNGDGKADVVVGHPGEDEGIVVEAGAITELRSDGTKIANIGQVLSQGGLLDTPEAGDAFG